MSTPAPRPTTLAVVASAGTGNEVVTYKVLQKFLWGDYYYSEKKVFRKPCHDRHRPMFVQFVLDPVIGEYRKHLQDADVSSATEVREARTKIKNQLCKWMPMEKGILGMVVQHLPSPPEA
jgi:hypothetical protein